jgi:hypothetical protein
MKGCRDGNRLMSNMRRKRKKEKENFSHTSMYGQRVDINISRCKASPASSS